MDDDEQWASGHRTGCVAAAVCGCNSCPVLCRDDTPDLDNQQEILALSYQTCDTDISLYTCVVTVLFLTFKF